MKIVTWNCAGAFRKKYELLASFDADILVIQECEDPSASILNYKDWAENFLWIGEKHKGVGVFAKRNIKIEKLEWADHGLRYFLPCRVDDRFNLVAVWTKSGDDHDFRYVGQLWKYLQFHEARLALQPTVICGDFNSNAIWDKEHKGSSHSDVVNQLSKLGIESLYHQYRNEEHGGETINTFFMHRKVHKPYHIDYAFMPQCLASNSSEIRLGKFEEWIEHSDHVPIAFQVSDG